MKTRFITLLAFLLFLAVAPALAQDVTGPQPLGKADPRAKRAGELVEVMLKKDRKAVEAYLKQHGAASYAGSQAMKEQLDRHLAWMKAGKQTVSRFERGRGSDVLVWLRDETGREQNVVVQMEPAAPFKFTGLLQARIQRG